MDEVLERELKWDVDEHFAVPRLDDIVAGSDVERSTVTLNSAYYDTADGDLGAESMTPGVGDPIPVARGADRRHIDQRLAQPHAGEGVGQLRRRVVGQPRADLDASLGVGHLELPAGVVIAFAPPQQHTVGL